jgi:hypothetical protein
LPSSLGLFVISFFFERASFFGSYDNGTAFCAVTGSSTCAPPAALFKGAQYPREEHIRSLRVRAMHPRPKSRRVVAKWRKCMLNRIGTDKWAGQQSGEKAKRWEQLLF